MDKNKNLKVGKNNKFSLSYRPREKLYYSGKNSLSNVELLAIILNSGYKNLPVLSLAKNILKKIPLNKWHEIFLLKNPQQEQQLLGDLQSISGLGFAQASKIIAAIELGRRSLQEAKSHPLHSPQEVYNYCSDLKNKKQEYCLAFFSMVSKNYYSKKSSLLVA